MLRCADRSRIASRVLRLSAAEGQTHKQSLTTCRALPNSPPLVHVDASSHARAAAPPLDYSTPRIAAIRIAAKASSALCFEAGWLMKDFVGSSQVPDSKQGQSRSVALPSCRWCSFLFSLWLTHGGDITIRPRVASSTQSTGNSCRWQAPCPVCLLCLLMFCIYETHRWLPLVSASG